MAVLLAAGVPPAAAQSIGVVKSVRGDVTILRGDQGQIATVGDELHRLDTIKTGEASAAGVILDDGTTVALGSHAAFEIADYAFEPSTGVFNLVLRGLFGRIVYGSGRIGEAQPENVRIETPFLSVGTRGTRFAVMLPGSAQ
jgi:hypothetical protein